MMEENSTEISIIIPVYNSEKYLIETINSVLNQTYENWEMILVDDGSNDMSWDIIKEYEKKDHRIKSFQFLENFGTSMARNKAIELAQGRFIAFLDSDDLWHPVKLKSQLLFMKQNNYALTFTSYHQINQEGEKIGEIIAENEITYKDALFYNPIGCLTAMYDSNQLGKCYMPLIRKRQDYAMWLMLLKKTNAYGLIDVLAFYRLREDSLSFNKLKLIKFQWQLFRKIEKFSWIKSGNYIFSNIIRKLIKLWLVIYMFPL